MKRTQTIGRERERVSDYYLSIQLAFEVCCVLIQWTESQTNLALVRLHYLCLDCDEIERKAGERGGKNRKLLLNYLAWRSRRILITRISFYACLIKLANGICICLLFSGGQTAFYSPLFDSFYSLSLSFSVARNKHQHQFEPCDWTSGERRVPLLFATSR